ncbi:MAG TPA: DEAD/DEAH box helicase, partial [Anaerolineae bacterium]
GNAPMNILRSVEPNTAFYDAVAPVIDVTVQRSVALAALYLSSIRDEMWPGSALVVSSPRALMHPSMSISQFKSMTRTLRRDQTLTLESLLAQWLTIGYQNESVVERIGAFSRRGGIIDVWSPAHTLPARIELFGNQIESIRQFEPGTQRSGELLERLIITPYESAGNASPNAESRTAPYPTALDYLGPDGLVVIDDEMELHDAWVALESKAERDRMTMLPTEAVGLARGRASGTGGDTTHQEVASVPYVTWDGYASMRDQQLRTVILGQADNDIATPRHPLATHFSIPPHFGGQLSPVMDFLRARNETEFAENEPSTTIVLSRQAARLAEMWSERNSAISTQKALDEEPSGALTFITGALPEGVVYSAQRDERYESSTTNPRTPTSNLTLLTDSELFGYVRPDAWQYSKTRKPAPERAFADWQPGDVVVHEDYGVGIFRGLAHLTVNTGTLMEPSEGEREYILLEYADADKRYVPLHQLDRISRYVGSDDSRPTLSKLGTTEWSQTRQKARGAAAQVARDMLKLYAAREMAKGVAFSKDTTWQAELEASFPYIETDDQLQAIQDVKADLERAKPMDRLVCGDVGFGKTEVALRAAFKAVQDDYQVAVLVPTTVLAQQHWLTFTRRLAPYPIRIEMLSRFRTSAEKHKVLEGLREGSVDIVIGTHALLSGSVQFANLGMLIIDEEQRFGVTAKEKLKQMRTNVHVMTLTATPIPRTLYFGLSGIRDVSRIETPPAERLPIISYVGAFDDHVI